MVDETIVRNFSLSKLIFFSTRCEVQVKQLHTIRTFIVIKERREKEELTLPLLSFERGPKKWAEFDPSGSILGLIESIFGSIRAYSSTTADIPGDPSDSIIKFIRQTLYAAFISLISHSFFIDGIGTRS